MNIVGTDNREAFRARSAPQLGPVLWAPKCCLQKPQENRVTLPQKQDIFNLPSPEVTPSYPASMSQLGWSCACTGMSRWSSYVPWGTFLTSAPSMSHQLLFHPPAWADVLSELRSPEWHEMSTLRSLNSSGVITELELPSTGIFTLPSQGSWLRWLTSGDGQAPLEDNESRS